MDEVLEEASDNQDAKAVNRHLTNLLVEAGERLGLVVRREFPLRRAIIDVVWLWEPPQPLPGVEGALPLVGFEVESSWRTRKHVKGDLLNLQDLGPALGVIVLAGSGPKVEGLRDFARDLTDRPGLLVLVWTEDDVEALARGDVAPLSVATPGPTRGRRLGTGGVHVREHDGKYRALCEWLRAQTDNEVQTSFHEIEVRLGFPLPPSCRKHEAHWRGYDGSAVGRAIRDAGWRTDHVDIAAETVDFRRDS